jgi:hypothetical protein
VTAGKVLYECYKSTAAWPTVLVDAYLDDALGCREWVDNPSLTAFCGNLLYWTKFCDTVLSKQTLSNEREIELSSDDESNVGNVTFEESSGDEEEVVIEESSTPTLAANLSHSPPPQHSQSQGQGIHALTPPPIHNNNPNITDRFCGHYLALSDTVSAMLLARSSISSSQVIMTVQTFCSLASIRLLATKCIPAWLGNPALVEHIGRLISRVAECLLAAGM